MEKRFWVYILTNGSNKVLYTGITNDIRRRVWQHKNGLTEGFTSKYKLKKLVFAEGFDRAKEAIEREKQIKAGSRKRKIELIEKTNPCWKELTVS